MGFSLWDRPSKSSEGARKATEKLLPASFTQQKEKLSVESGRTGWEVEGCRWCGRTATARGGACMHGFGIPMEMIQRRLLMLGHSSNTGSAPDSAKKKTDVL